MLTREGQLEVTAVSEFSQGWRALLASSVGNASGLAGLAFYTFGVFVVPLVEAFGWSRGQVSMAASFLIVGTAITAPVIGTIIDRYGARRVAMLSLLGLGIGYLLLTRLGGNIAAFYAAWLFMSLIGGGTTPVVWTRTVNMWFDRSRGLALGLTLAGAGAAGIFGPLFCTALIEAYGWQAGYLGVGALILLVSLPVIALLFKERPVEVGLDAGKQGAAMPEREGLTFQQSIRTVWFWKIVIAFFLVSGAIAGLIINVVPLLMDRGLTALDAARIAGALGIAVVFGRVCVGYLLDRFHAPLVACLLLAGTAAGCMLLVIEGAPTWVAVVSVISLGLAAAAEVDLVAYLVSRYFGMRAYGKVYGSQLTAFYLGAAVGPVAIGLVYDQFGSYMHILYASCAILIFGALAVGTLGKPPDFSKPVG